MRFMAEGPIFTDANQRFPEGSELFKDDGDNGAEEDNTQEDENMPKSRRGPRDKRSQLELAASGLMNISQGAAKGTIMAYKGAKAIAGGVNAAANYIVPSPQREYAKLQGEVNKLEERKIMKERIEELKRRRDALRNNKKENKPKEAYA